MARKLPTIESTIDSVLRAGRGYPDAEWLSQYRGISVQEAYDTMMRHYTASDLSVDPPVRPVIKPEPMPSPVKQPQQQSILHRVHDVPKEALKVIFGLLSVLCAVRSWGFIYGWFNRYDDSMAWVMATVLTGALIAMPQALVYAWKDRRVIICILTAIVALVSVAFAMITTTGGLYNDRSKSFVAMGTARIGDEKNEQAISEIQDSIKSIEQSISDDRAELPILTKNLEKYETGSYEYNRTVIRIDATKGRIDANNKKIDKLKSDKTNFSMAINTVAEREDFYDFLSNVTGARKEDIEFIISIIVSIIVDIVGPLFATLALFL